MIKDMQFVGTHNCSVIFLINSEILCSNFVVN